MTTPTSPTCWIIAGPNGAGKTTFALQYLPTVANCRNFVNADLIAAGLAPLAPETELLAANRLFLREIAAHIQARQDFAFETTLSGRSYLKLIHRLKAATYSTNSAMRSIQSNAI
jgi:predicted ABC-type ATPase